MNGDLDSDGDRRLLAGAELVNKMRAAVWEQTGFRCSAGIAHNKMLAKLSCGLYKPNRQTVMPMRSVEPFFRTLGLHKVRHLGGKLGQILIERYQCETMADVAAIPERVLQQRFDEKTGYRRRLTFPVLTRMQRSMIHSPLHRVPGGTRSSQLRSPDHLKIRFCSCAPPVEGLGALC